MTALAFHDHFQELAPRYRVLRGLDARAVRRTARRIAHRYATAAGLNLLDVGTGPGRYLGAVAAELEHVGVAVASATGVDASRGMLETFRDGLPRARPTNALADVLPFAAGSFDVVMSFNALHHFPSLPAFLAEAARVLKPGGLLVLYTRTPEQNRATIWGQHFPGFAARETRLYSRDALRRALEETGEFQSVRLRVVASWWWATLPGLVRRARRRYYSTFRYYSAAEFEEAVTAFQRRVRERYPYPWAIPARNNHLIAFGVRRA